jgi:hypothetical protein
MATTTALNEVATVRQTAAAHASALNELERAFSAQTVRNKTAEKKCALIISKKKQLLKEEERFFGKCPPTTTDRAR